MSDDYRTEPVDSARRVLARASGYDSHPRRHPPAHAYEPAPPPPQPHDAADMASVLGLPASAVTPALLAAVMPLLAEIDRLNWLLTQAEHRAEWVERQADRHSLVPCLTRRAFVREVDTLLAGGGRGTLALVQVAGVEALRRDHGFPAGEAAMRHLAAILVGALRASDIIGCLGGADFAVLLPGTGQDQARLKLETICTRMVEPPFVWLDRQVPLCPAFGLHELTAGDGAETALAAADRARRGLE